MKNKIFNVYVLFIIMLCCLQCNNNLSSLISSDQFHGLKYETLNINDLKNIRSTENDRIKIIVEKDSLKILYKEVDKIKQKTIEIAAWSYGDYFKTACEETNEFRICEYTRFHPDGKLGEISEAKFPKLKSGKTFCANFSTDKYVYYDTEENIRSISFDDIDEKDFSLPFDKILKNLEREGINLSCEEEFTRLGRMTLSGALQKGYMKEEYYYSIGGGELDSITFKRNIEEYYHEDYFSQFYFNEVPHMFLLDKGFWCIYDNRNRKVYVFGGNSGILVYNGPEK